MWRKPIPAKPLNHDCQLVDVDADGVKDCIVVGEGGIMTAIKPRTGGWESAIISLFTSILERAVFPFLSAFQAKNYGLSTITSPW